MSNIGKSLFLSNIPKAWIERASFHFFSFSRGRQVLRSGSDDSSQVRCGDLDNPAFQVTEDSFACSFSLSEVSRKIAEICSNPSFFAALEKKLYRVRAYDSPENTARRLFSVGLPLNSIKIASNVRDVNFFPGIRIIRVSIILF
jgi:hypothetical protein